MISRTLHERLKLSETPIKSRIMGVGGAITTVTKEGEVPLRFGKKNRPVKALVCDQVPVGDILLAADWLYEHTVGTTHRPPAIWFGGDKNTMIHAIIETPQLKATTTSTVDCLYLQRYAKLFSKHTTLPRHATGWTTNSASQGGRSRHRNRRQRHGSDRLHPRTARRPP